MKTLGLVIVLAAALAGCQETNPNYCAGAPDHNCNEGGSGGDGGSTACTTSAQCSGGTPVCDTTKNGGTCVQCTTGEANACIDTTPVCGTTDSCRACATHDECVATSDACLSSGACAPVDQVAYVDGGGADTNDCSVTHPCATITMALTTGKKVIKVSGAIFDHFAISQDVTIVAAAGASVERQGSYAGTLITVSGSPTVEIDDLVIKNASGGTGISLMGGTLTLLRATLQANQNGGIVASAGTLNMSRCTVADNSGIGIELTGAAFDIENCFITGNGSTNAATGTSTGGIYIVSVSPGTAVIQFNTIAENYAKATLPAGVGCGLLSPALALPNNIIYNNHTLDAMPNQVSTTGCTYSFSDIGFPGTSNVIAGMGNVNTNPVFASASNYHLMTSSPLVDQADPSAVEPFDVDGQTRPMGNARDIGADEAN